MCDWSTLNKVAAEQETDREREREREKEREGEREAWRCRQGAAPGAVFTLLSL